MAGKKGYLRNEFLRNWTNLRKLTAMPYTEAVLEALVMVGVVTRVVGCLLGTGYLFYEAAALVVVTAVSLGLELGWGRNPLIRHLKPRTSLSTGILVGSVTLPIVHSSRLVQLLRCSSSPEISVMEMEKLRYEFWLAATCSMSMLVLLLGLLWKHSVGSWICLTVLEYSSVAVLILMTPKQGLDTNWMGLWGAVYILGGKILFNYTLRAFPFSGTIGEVILVVEGIVLSISNAAASTLERILLVSPGDPGDLIAEQHFTWAVLQGVILGVLLIPVVYNTIYTGIPWFLNSSRVVRALEQRFKGGLFPFCRFWKAGLFYVVVLLVLFVAVPRWLRLVIGTQLNPVLWTMEFVLQRPAERLMLCMYWVAVVCIPLPYLYRISASGLVPKILVRKYYHAMIVVLFLPALLLDAIFLQLAFGVALSGFLVVEMIRVWRFPPFGHLIDKYMTAFADHRDSGILIISHFSLLLGCALPVWLNSGPGDRPLASFAGILSLGVGDTMASVIGYNFGSIRVSAKSRKTVEGTLSCIASTLAFCLLLIPMLSPHDRPTGVSEYLSLASSTVANGVLEAYILQLDNAFLPLIFYSLLCL